MPTRPYSPTILAPLLLAFCLLCGWAPKRTDGVVVVYCSVDDIYAKPILRNFERRTGIKVQPRFDVEAEKTTGLVGRLMAERARPRADVFWNSEASRTLALHRAGLLQPYRSPSAKDIPAAFKDREGYWTGCAARARVICYNTKLVRKQDAPRSLLDLTKPQWRGKVGICNPLIGTASSWAAALFVVWGEERATKFFRDLQANGVRVLPGNSVVADQTARGEILVGVTDTDDVYLRQQQRQPIDLVFPDADGIGTLLIPTTISLIKGAPHPDAGKRLVDYLLSREVEAALAASPARQMPVRADVPTPKEFTQLNAVRPLRVKLLKVSEALDPMRRRLEKLFLLNE